MIVGVLFVCFNLFNKKQGYSLRVSKKEILEVKREQNIGKS